MPATSERPAAPRPAARERLLVAADELFYGHGIATTGVDAVLDRADVSIASLYRHFGSKDGLVAAYLERREERWNARWAAARDQASTPDGRVLALFDALRTWTDEQPDSRGCALLAALAQLPPGHPAAVAARGHKQGLWERVHGLVAAVVDDDRVDSVTEQVVLAYEGALSRLAVAGPSPDPVATARELAARALGQAGVATPSG